MVDEEEVVYTMVGETLRFQERLAADLAGPPLHFHPKQIERFEVLEGSMTVRFRDEQRLLQAGESIEIAAGCVHSFHTQGSEGALVIVELTPASEMEMFFRGIGKAQRERLHPLLQIAVTYEASKEFAFYLAGMPMWLQKILFTVLAPIARLKGYSAVKV